VLILGRGSADGQTPGWPIHPPGPFSSIGIDKLAPELRLRGRTSQRFVRRAVNVLAKCSEQCTVTATARVSLGRASRSFRSLSVKRALRAGTRTRLSFKFSRRAVGAVRRALKRKRRLFAEVTVRSHDPAGNSSTTERKIRLKL
jgi:hypothetical protein